MEQFRQLKLITLISALFVGFALILFWTKSWVNDSIRPLNQCLTLRLPDSIESEYRIKFGFVNQGSHPARVRLETCHQKSCALTDEVLLDPGDIGIHEVAIKKDAVPLGSFRKFAFQFVTSGPSPQAIRVSAMLTRKVDDEIGH